MKQYQCDVDRTKDYSEKEKQLIKAFGYENLLTVVAPTLYRMMVEKAFINDMKGPHVESLRRCAKALQECKIYRLTKEWDDMIQLE
jgi:hypothetical protein